MDTRQANGNDVPRARGAKHPLAWYVPRFWHGMTLSTWMRELYRNHFAVSPILVPMACTVSAVAAVNSGLSLVDRIVRRRSTAATRAPEAPLFVLGHWRSGTTFLHELLVRDPNHSFANTYQCFAPHHFPLTERWLVPCIRGLMPERRPMDNMTAGWERPMEDEFALQNCGVPTPYLTTMFPNRGEAYPEYLTLRTLTPRQRDRWKRSLLDFCTRLAMRDRRRLVLKSPAHTARIRTILEVFPNAKFIHVSRDPHAVFRSTLDLWRTLNSEVGLQRVRSDDWLEGYVIRTLRRMYEAYFEDRLLLGSRQLVELKYEDLVREPLRQLHRCYQQLQLGDFSVAEPAFKQHLSEVGNYQRNSQAESDRWRHLVDSAWTEYSERFGYSSLGAIAHAA